MLASSLEGESSDALVTGYRVLEKLVQQKFQVLLAIHQSYECFLC
jgi:hypothetical protein